jgi:hypothetical protein
MPAGRDEKKAGAQAEAGELCREARGATMPGNDVPEKRSAKACANHISLPMARHRVVGGSDMLPGRDMSMTDAAIGQITLVCRGDTQQFHTVS